VRVPDIFLGSYRWYIIGFFVSKLPEDRGSGQEGTTIKASERTKRKAKLNLQIFLKFLSMARTTAA